MYPLYSEFAAYLDDENKEKCVFFVIQKLAQKTLDVVTLYNEILTPAMYADFCKADQKEICIWKEHVRTSIVRTCVECSFPYVIRERSEKYNLSDKGDVALVCPPGELHELGAIMASDFFTLCGFDVLFVGANTPQKQIVQAIEYARPEYVAISITNYYNLVNVETIIRRIAELKEDRPFKIILGGQACRNNREVCRQMEADMILDSFSDIKSLSEGH